MGQAKARGSKEQRVLEGIEKAHIAEFKRKQEVAARKRKDDEYLASLSEEDRKAILAKRLFFNTIISMASEYPSPINILSR